MGRGIIKENLGEGLYRVEIDLDTNRIVRRREELQRQLDQLDIDITAQETTVADLEDAWQADRENAEKLAALMSARSELAHMHARRAAARSALETLQGANVQDYQVDIWCADYTLDLSAGKYVGIAEIPGELRWGNIRPAYDGRADYTQARDGAMNPALNMPPASAVLYWALRPSWQRYHPTYRYGTLTAIDTDLDTATVELMPMASSDQKIDVNLETTLSNIPVFYMDCNATAFEIGDEVLVEFPNLDWPSARVAGFRRQPKRCQFVDYIRFSVNGHSVCLFLTSPYGAARILDAETGQFIIPPEQTLPERVFAGDLMYVGDMILTGNEYVDLSAIAYTDYYPEGVLEFRPYKNRKNWQHNRQVFPQDLSVQDGIPALLSDDIFGHANTLNPNANLPILTAGDAGRIIRVFASPFSNRFKINSVQIETGTMQAFLWTGAEWVRHGGPEINYLQYRYVQFYEDTRLIDGCPEGGNPPSVDLVFWGNTWLQYSVDAGVPVSAQVNWILHPELLADANITEETIDGQTVRVANINYIAKRINENRNIARVCDVQEIVDESEPGANYLLYNEVTFLGYQSIAGGVSGWGSPPSTDGRQMIYSFSNYCDSNDRLCFGYYSVSHTQADIENLVVVSDALGRNPTFTGSEIRIGVTYSYLNDDDSTVWEGVDPKIIKTFTMEDA